MKNTQSYRELRTQLDEIMMWFEQDDIDIDEAMKKYEEAEAVIKALEVYLSETELKIKKLKTN